MNSQSPTEPDFHLEVINKQWISTIENEHFLITIPVYSYSLI